VAIICGVGSVCQADERLRLDAKINGKPVTLFFDTGSSAFTLWRETAQRLGITVSKPADFSGAPYLAQISEECKLSLEGRTGKTKFIVVENKSNVSLNFDGVIGWGQLTEPEDKKIVRIDVESQRITFLDKVPGYALKWTQLPVVLNSNTLKLEIRNSGEDDGILDVDTGAPHGVSLAPRQWSMWKAEHANQPTTIDSFYMPAGGIVTVEESWAMKLVLGPLVLSDLPVGESAPIEQQLGGKRYVGSLGLAALKRFDVIIDSKHGVAYLRPKKSHHAPYPHNRLGAAFVPASTRSDELVGRVAPGSPAQAAGVKNGDVLLKVDGIDVTLRSPGAMKKFWTAAGTKVNLMLKRDGDTFETTAILREILPPVDGEK